MIIMVASWYASTSRADMVVPTTLGKRYAAADCVVQGKVIGVESFWTKLWFVSLHPKDTSSDNERLEKQFRLIASIVSIAAEKQIKPCAASETVRFQVRGGRVGNRSTNFPSGHHYAVGREMVLFLRKIPKDSSLTEYAEEKDFDYLHNGLNSVYYVNRKDGKVTLRGAFSGLQLGKEKIEDEVPLEYLEDLSGK